MSLEHYETLKAVGKGSYGEVWLVKHRKDKKQYVIKKMEMLNASRRERTAAEQEAKLLSRLRHPNIVSYKDSFESDDGYLYIVMGFCDGGDLYHRLKEQKGMALEEKQVVEWFVQIAMALQYMHERNILHRDLKTQNIFLTKSKIIKVGDLGIARVLEGNNDMATTLIGTPYYMSPELFSNKPYNHKSDVWALGCCVYEMATLKHAFNAKDMNSLVYKILRGKMPAMPKSYSEELIELIKAMLNLAPEKRPSVARILRNPFIKRHIAIFLEGTRSRRPNSGTSERRPSKPDITDVSNFSPQTAAVSDVPPGGALSPITEVPTKSEKKPSSTPRVSSGDAKKSAKTRPSSSGSKDKKDSAKDGAKSAASRKPRPLPTPPANAGTPRKSASVSKTPSGSRSTAAPSSSSSSSVSSSKESVATPRTEEEGRRSVNPSARMRRREKLRESQEGAATGPTVRSSADSATSRKSSNNVVKTRASRSKSDPTPPHVVKVKGHDQVDSTASKVKGEDEVDTPSGRADRPSVGDDDSDDSTDAPEKAKKREEKEMSAFSSLLESTLKLDIPNIEEEINESPDEPEDTPDSSVRRGSVDPLSGTVDIFIKPAAPRAPKGLGNATMTTSGRLMDRIAALRKDIMNGIGIEVLQKAYDCLDNEDEDSVEATLVALMGRAKFEIYGGKIWQLKFCEETVFG
ncbi:serine/threonine-protein kinase Nek4-like isoform X2 [Acanthaster planci]|uniref:Serine/threonine-protein kinase Nek4 n=1 Tax=Acanthaster planci TaxID=133434 RepID=A0A8B7YXM0_ACAPL|nr:serine/threonine-protein kinase Nek4-like isoform X2 [Acanthaster planci]